MIFRLKGNTRDQFLKRSFSQCGEDLIIEYVFNFLNIKHPTYWDIGAFHPFNMSNTALFYEKGSVGVNIEPNPDLIEPFKKFRTKDINLNIGIAKISGEGIYYKMDAPSLNTFSQQDSSHCVAQGHKLLGEVVLPLISAESISELHYHNTWPDFISLDVEGLDLDILKSLKYDNDHLHLVCVETISYSPTGMGKKNIELIQFMESNGYFLYADTYINSIFVKKESWKKRGQQSLSN